VIRQIDWRAAGFGAAVTLAVLEPPVQIINALKANDRTGAESYWWVVGAVAVLVSFAVGGWFAARRRPSTPFMHGAAAAALAFAVHLVVRTIVKLATGESATFGLANTLLLGQIAVSLGILGAYVSTRWHAHRTTS
jgi:predicted permease